MAKKIEWNSYLATAYAEGFCEGEGASEDEQLQAWQYLVDTGLCWKLQGWFGRTAKDLLDEGLLHKPKKKSPENSHDYYGNELWNKK